MKQEEMISVRSMQWYLKEHLMDDVSMGELSHVSFYSPWHSYRIFKELVGDRGYIELKAVKKI